MSDPVGWIVFVLVAAVLLRPLFRGFRSGLRGDEDGNDPDFSLEVVGEASYQQNLIAVAGPKREESSNVVVEAEVVYEDSNPHDRQAVRIDVQGKTVGYLSRDNARRWRNTVASNRVTCTAVIRGGWNRGPNDVGHYGVWLRPPRKFR